MGRWSKCGLLIEMALVVHAKIFVKRNFRKRTAPHKWLTQRPERKHHILILASIPSHFPILYESCRVFEIIVTVAVMPNGNSHTFNLSTYVIVKSFSLTLIIIDMKRKSSYEEISKFKKSSLSLIHGPGPATWTSTHIANTNDLIPSIPSGDTTASTQVSTAGFSVSVQLRPSHLYVLIFCYWADRS